MKNKILEAILYSAVITGCVDNKVPDVDPSEFNDQIINVLKSDDGFHDFELDTTVEKDMNDLELDMKVEDDMSDVELDMMIEKDMNPVEVDIMIEGDMNTVELDMILEGDMNTVDVDMMPELDLEIDFWDFCDMSFRSYEFLLADTQILLLDSTKNVGRFEVISNCDLDFKTINL